MTAILYEWRTGEWEKWRMEDKKMNSKKTPGDKAEFFPLNEARWQDFLSLFGKSGACGGCWCMWYRLKRSEFEQNKGDGNKKLMALIVQSGEIPGILAYVDGKAVGWCSVAPRTQFPALEHSRILKRIDNKPVWSIVCFYIDKAYRRKGLTGELLNYVIEYCKEQGAEIIEAYPTDPRKKEMPDVFAWTGFASTFFRAGFKEAARRSETRPLLRYVIKNEHS